MHSSYQAEKLIEHYSRYWKSIIGTRGTVGKKTINSTSMFHNLFETEQEPEYLRDDSGLSQDSLDQLEVINE